METAYGIMSSTGTNEASRLYRELRRRAMVEVHRAFGDGVDLAITVDDGKPIAGYRELSRAQPGRGAVREFCLPESLR